MTDLRQAPSGETARPDDLEELYRRTGGRPGESVVASAVPTSASFGPCDESQDACHTGTPRG